jgi:hypothetical protein
MQTGLQTSAMSVAPVSLFVGQSLIASGYRASADAANARYLQWVTVTAIANQSLVTDIDPQFSPGTALIQPASGDVVAVFDGQNTVIVTPDDLGRLQAQDGGDADAFAAPDAADDDAGPIDDSNSASVQDAGDDAWDSITDDTGDDSGDDSGDDPPEDDDSGANLGNFGDPCDTPGDCASGLCLQACTRACGGTNGRCPDGYWCTAEGDLGSVCAPH